MTLLHESVALPVARSLTHHHALRRIAPRVFAVNPRLCLAGIVLYQARQGFKQSHLQDLPRIDCLVVRETLIVLFPGWRVRSINGRLPNGAHPPSFAQCTNPTSDYAQQKTSTEMLPFRC